MQAGFRFSLVLASVTVLYSTVLLLPGTLRVTGHEGDLLHTLDLVYRMVEGDRPHIDFMTPLGVMSIAPIAFFAKLGYGPGHSIALAQVAVCLAFLPMVWWVAMSRLDGVLRYAFAIAMVVLATALVFGGPTPSLSLSMYYNRWAWIACSLVVVLLMLPARPGWRSVIADSVILGLCGGVLVLLKATYVLGLLPFVIVALINDRAGRVFIGATLVMAATLGAATLVFGGVEFWTSYAGDLLEVAGSKHRAKPGEDIGGLLGKPPFLTGTLALLLTVIYWRKTGLLREGLLLLILAPGFVYITYQNWGNDPKWLFLLAVLILARPVERGTRTFWGAEARNFGIGIALVALSFFSPSMANLGYSVFRHAALTDTDYTPIFTDPQRSDIAVRRNAHRTPHVNMALAGVVFSDDPVTTDAGDDDSPVTLNGETLPDCDVSQGFVGWLRQMLAQLEAVDEAVGRHVLVADLYDFFWLFGPFQRHQGMAPWFYGADRGFDQAEYLLVPTCPLSKSSRRGKLALIEARGWDLTEVIRTDHFILMKRAN